ncbi:MAG: PaaI family thioesterase [Candidatus Dormibacter sp.]
MSDRITPGDRFLDARAWGSSELAGPHVWRTLDYRRTGWQPGSTTIEWQATADYCFPTADGPVVQGGLVTALLDSAMGGACWTVLNNDEVFLTADLRVEFLRVSRPELLVAIGTVIRRTRRVVFCSAEMRGADERLLATSRCTQVVLPDAGPFGRDAAPDETGAPPEDARG